jgi:Fungal specific transcription factor domain
MKAEIDKLRAHNLVTERILQALVGDDEQASAIISQLKDGDSLQNISNNLGSLEDTPSGGDERSSRHDSSEFFSSPAGSKMSDRPVSTRRQSGDSSNVFDEGEKMDYEPIIGHPKQARHKTLSGPDDGSHMMSELTFGSAGKGKERVDRSNIVANVVSDEPWTRVSDNKAFIEHLLSLYFCWEYPTFATVSKEHFLDDFSHGRRRYCSSMLVNSMLALACRFCDQPEARADPNNSDTAGDHFFEEAKQSLALDSSPNITTVQALGLMSLREASCGRESMSMLYSHQSMKMSMAMDLHLDNVGHNNQKFTKEELEVRAATAWGCFTLEQYVKAFMTSSETV